MTEGIKQRTVTITGPLGIDADGDLYGRDRWGNPYAYFIGELQKNSEYAFAIEDARRKLPTIEGAVIRATVTYGYEDYPGVLLRFSDPGDSCPWRVLDWGARAVAGYAHWISDDQISGDWVELVPAEQ